jgi:hypothetical protein
MNYTTKTLFGLAASMLMIGGASAADGGNMTQSNPGRETRVEGKAENEARIERRTEETLAGEANPGGPLNTTTNENQPSNSNDSIVERERNTANMELKRGENITVTGRVVDLTSYLSDGEITSFDPAKVKAGEAPMIGLVSSDRKVHLILNADQNSEFMRTLKNQSADRYTVTGDRIERGGLCAIKVKSASVSTGTEASDAMENNRSSQSNQSNQSAETGDFSTYGDNKESGALDGSGDPNAKNDGKDVDSNLKDRGPASTNNPALKAN